MTSFSVKAIFLCLFSTLSFAQADSWLSERNLPLPSDFTEQLSIAESAEVDTIDLAYTALLCTYALTPRQNGLIVSQSARIPVDQAASCVRILERALPRFSEFQAFILGPEGVPGTLYTRENLEARVNQALLNVVLNFDSDSYPDVSFATPALKAITLPLNATPAPREDAALQVAYNDLVLEPLLDSLNKKNDPITPAGEWQQVVGSTFCFQIPADFKNQFAQGIDSEVGKYTRGDLQVSYDSGMYTNKGPTQAQCPECSIVQKHDLKAYSYVEDNGVRTLSLYVPDPAFGALGITIRFPEKDSAVHRKTAQLILNSLLLGTRCYRETAQED